MVPEPRSGIDLDATAEVTPRFFRATQTGAERPDTDRVVVGRYILRELIGQGGHGTVWRSDDLLVGRTVAVKLLTAGSRVEPARVRREVSALRLLRVPGVVELFDEGVDRGQPFLVMHLVDGEPFPGMDRPQPWASIAEITRGLLDTVGRMHAAGVLHRDLKPGNVLVSPSGEVTVLDFGLAVAPAQGTDLTAASAILGTPAYLSPEQLLGDAVSARTDLYAVGLMLYQTLSGRLPHDADRVGELLRGRATAPPPPLCAAMAGVPAEVGEVVDALLAVRADERPRSAAEVLDRLGLSSATPSRTKLAGAMADLGGDRGATTAATGEAQGGEAPAAHGALDEATLRALFSGSERIFHVPSDGARVLAARTGGDPARVTDEVSAWVRANLARWDGARLAMDRDALDRIDLGLGVAPATIEPVPADGTWSWDAQRHAHRAAAEALAPGTAARLWHLMLADGGGNVGARTEVAREARALARQLARAGRLGQAAAVLFEALLAVRRRPLPRGAQEDAASLSILSTWTEVAMAESSPRALDRVLYELCRAEPRSALVRKLEDLVRAALAVPSGGERALALASALEPFSDRGLERRRQALRMLAARRCPLPTEEAVLAEVTGWAAEAGDPEASALVAGWTGRLRYRQGRFEEAAESHLGSARGQRWAAARVNEQLNAASALLEAFAFERASAVADEARRIAAACRHPYFEARAEWIVRSSAYRAGTAREPDLELCDLATRVGVVDLEALICLNEAAVAWRADAGGRATALAGRAQRLWTTSGWRAGSLLARTLAMAAGRRADPSEASDLAAQARLITVPGIGLQALGLVARVAPEAAITPPEVLNTLVAGVPAEHWARRMDVVSVEEALQALGVDPASLEPRSRRGSPR